MGKIPLDLEFNLDPSINRVKQFYHKNGFNLTHTSDNQSYYLLSLHDTSVGCFMAKPGAPLSYTGGYMWDPSKNSSYIVESLVIDKNHRKQGLGTYMMSRYIALRAPDDVYLFVDIDNKPAISVYDKLGFQVVGNHATRPQYLMRYQTRDNPVFYAL